MDNKRSPTMREIIISEVQTRPSLWDNAHPQYENAKRIKKIWEEIDETVGTTGVYYSLRYLHERT